MAKQTKSMRTSRIRHSEEYKAEALELAEHLGVGAAAQQLGLHESQLYARRSTGLARGSRAAMPSGGRRRR